MRFAAVQFDIVWEDKTANHAKIEKMLAEDRPSIGPGPLFLLREWGDPGSSLNLDRLVDDRTIKGGAVLARRMRVFVHPASARRDSSTTGLPAGRNCAAIIDPQGKTLG